MVNLFALLKGTDISMLRIPLSADVQTEVTNMFVDQVTNFLADKEQIDFQGDYKSDPEEVFRITDFNLSQVILDGCDDPISLDVLNINQYQGRIVALIANSTDNNNRFIALQNFDSRKLLNRKFSLWYTDERYNRINDRGITVAEKIDGLFVNNALFFSSFTLASRMVDLTAYMMEATEEDVTEFIDSNLFSFEDATNFRTDLTRTMRKKLRIIVQSGIIEDIGVDAIRSKAEELELSIELNDNQDRVVIPRDKKRINELIRILNEDYFFSIFRGTKYLTNSKRAT